MPSYLCIFIISKYKGKDDRKIYFRQNSIGHRIRYAACMRVMAPVQNKRFTVNNINNCMCELKLVHSYTITQLHANTFTGKEAESVNTGSTVHTRYLLLHTVYTTVTHSHTRYCANNSLSRFIPHNTAHTTQLLCEAEQLEAVF